jgi:hypothetical protein
MTTTVTPPMRVHGWNVHLVAGADDFHFAGLYQVPGSNLITFRDVIDEMRLCFDIPGEEDPWETMAFMLADSPDDVKRKLHTLVADEDLALPVPGLQGSSPKVQRIVTYHVILHKPCNISFDKPLEDHLKGLMDPIKFHSFVLGFTNKICQTNVPNTSIDRHVDKIAAICL